MATKNDGARALGPAALQQNPSLPFLLGCCCIGLILLAAALTVVMALIPTYLPNKGDGITRVNATNMEAYVAAQAATTRKRQVSGLTDCEGCTFGDEGLMQLGNTAKQYLVSGQVTDVTADSVTIGYLSSTTKKRSVLDREVRQGDVLIYLIRLLIKVHPACLYACQLKVADEVQTKLANMPPAAFVFNNVPMYRDGEYQSTLSNLRIRGITYVSKLSPGKTQGRPGKAPTLRSRSTTTIMPTTPMSG